MGIGDPGGYRPAPLAVSQPRRAGEGSKTKSQIARPQLASAPPPSAPAAGARYLPLVPPPPPQSFHSGFGASRAHPEPPAAPLPSATYALLAEHSHRACAPQRPLSLPGARLPRLRPVAGGGLWSPARPPGSYRCSHSGGSCPGAVGGRPRETRELGGQAGVHWGRGAGGEHPSLVPCPARRANLSCQGPAAPQRLTHAGATVAQCLSKLLISPGAAAVAAAAAAWARWGGGASGAPAKKHLLLSRPPRTHPSATPPTPGPLARSRLPDLSQREVSGFSRKHTRARIDRRRVHPWGHKPLPS